MSKFKDMIIDIEEMSASGKFTVNQIADFFGIPVDAVAAIVQFDLDEELV